MEQITSSPITLLFMGLVTGALIVLVIIRLDRSPRRTRQFRGKFLGGRYRIGFELGRGMNAITYRVEDNMNPAIPLAAKVLLTPEEEPRISRSSFNRHVRRFNREIENLKKLKDCKFIVPLYDFRADNIQPFFVMKLCECSLQDELSSVPLPMDMILNILLDVCEGLQEIHDRKIIHRDLKPANILKHEGRWKLADFGMSLMGGYGGVVTVPDSLPGTIPYTAPEVMYNEPSTIGPLADIFSLGITLKAMFAGVTTYEVKTSALLPGRINMKTKRQIKLFDELIEEMTRMEPNDRPQSVSDIAKKIEEIFEEVNKIEGKKREILLSNKHRDRLKSIKKEEKEKKIGGLEKISSEPEPNEEILLILKTLARNASRYAERGGLNVVYENTFERKNQADFNIVLGTLHASGQIKISRIPDRDEIIHITDNGLLYYNKHKKRMKKK